MQNALSQYSKEFATDTITIHRREMQDVENLMIELKRLLAQYEKALDEEGIHEYVKTLERWMETYRRGLTAANKMAATGMGWLWDVRAHLNLAADETMRLESEGGHPASKEQLEKTEEFHKAVKCIDRVIPSLEKLFAMHN